ncbi:ubiquitin carboxyl-terminal hydrolase 7-like [Hordeum vulgare subsp. vulgare]|uniref:ubiquitin carboxyl-terminal hydrolase 7-like n=1 Tax=Hordeum vulgare subsp. vulgare TaxID=112509 RepID=UPI001D1A38ED|nr:ubiquitin carboxyl-terminal hydrolase 7-like [Hordeum vulgare subsp. vulgare]
MYVDSFFRYLTVQFVRFFWKRESNQKAEILRKVDYPLELDVYDFCSDELKLKLQTPRQVLRDAESAMFGLKVQVKTSSSQNIEAVSWQVVARKAGPDLSYPFLHVHLLLDLFLDEAEHGRVPREDRREN